MRMLVFLATLFTVLMLLVPSVHAQSTQYFSTSGDAAYYEEGKACFDQIGYDPTVGHSPGDETCVVLYGHIFNLLDKVPINIQRPPHQQPDLARGFTSNPNVEQAGFARSNELTLYSSPGFVEYMQPDQIEPRLHPERGITDNVEMGDADILGYWYMSADFDELTIAGGEPPAGNPDVGAMPCFTVRMVLETGRVHLRGDVIAEGQTTKVMVNQGAAADSGGALGDGVEVDCGVTGGGPASIMDPEKVTEFVVNLGPAQMDIPKIEAFLVFVEWFQFAPGDPDNQDKIGQHQWNLRTGGEHPNRVVLPIKNPVRIEELRPQFFDGKIYIHGVYNSPWGSYDVDPSSIDIKVYDQAGAEVAVNNIEAPIFRYSVDHDGHFKPVNATFPWDYAADGLAPGEYTIEVTVQNWQNTGSAVKTGKVVIGNSASDIQTIDDSGNIVENIDTRVGDVEEGSAGGFGLIVVSLLGLLGAARSLMRRS